MIRIPASGAVLIATLTLLICTACFHNPPHTKCSYSVVPMGTPVPDKGGNVLVRVTTDSGCTWAYQGNGSWITVGPDPDNTGTTGKGNGSVIVTVAANQGSARRVGTATIATKTFTVDQAGSTGSGCTFQVAPPERTFSGGNAATGQFTITASAQNCGWTASRSTTLEDTVDLTSGGSGGGREDRFGIGTATVGYQVKAQSPTSPWPSGGGDIVVRDSAQHVAATHHVRLQ